MSKNTIKTNNTTNTIDNIENIKTFVLQCLPTMKKELYKVMDKEDKELLLNKDNSKNTYIINYLKQFEDIKDINTSNTQLLNTLYAIDTIVSFMDYSKTLKDTWCKEVYEKYVDTYKIDTTNKEVVEVLQANIEELFNDIIKKCKQYIDSTSKLQKNLTILVDRLANNEIEVVKKQVKDIYNIEVNEKHLQVLYNGFINANNKTLTLKTSASRKYLLNGILRQLLKNKGFYSRKKFEYEVADTMKKVQFILDVEVQKGLSNTSELAQLANKVNYEIDTTSKDYDYRKAKKRLASYIKKNFVIISSELHAIIK